MTKEQFIKEAMDAGATKEVAELSWSDFQIWFAVCQKVKDNPNWPEPLEAPKERE